MKFATKVIHAGVHPDPETGAVMTPIYQTSTYAQDGPGNHKGYEYARTQNPTRTVLETNLAALENGVGAACFGSGLAAMDAVIKLLKSGDEVVPPMISMEVHIVSWSVYLVSWVSKANMCLCRM